MSSLFKSPSLSLPVSFPLSFPVSSFLTDRVVRPCFKHLHIAILFTWTDYKTIFFPITIFGSATAPVHSLSHLLQGCIWIWWHLLLCNVSNQAGSKEEDAINRPWRPLPSGRITVEQAAVLRKVVVFLCLAGSSFYGGDIALLTLGLTATTFFYDEMGLAAHPIGKNFCNIWGYTMFQAAATKLMSREHTLDSTSLSAVILSGLTIFTTIQAQDFPDVEGDAAIGRVTFPIYAPEFSRWFTLFAIPAWSVFLSWFWNVGLISSAAVLLLGAFVGARYFYLRTPTADKKTYLIFNVWLILMFLLPSHTRTGLLSF